MGTRARVALLATAASVAGLAYCGNEAVEHNHIPLIEALDELPPEIDTTQSMVCPAEPEICTPQTALAVLALKNQLPTTDFPAVMKEAVVAAEDRRFYEHAGVDSRGILRAIWRNWRAGEVVEGGSTIDRQTASLLYPKPTPEELRDMSVATDIAAAKDPKYGEEIYEAMLALTMNKTYAKDEILKKYLSNVYFGRGAYGLESAARAYFGIEAKNLNQQQAIVLSATLNGPSLQDVDGSDPTDPNLQAEYALLFSNYRKVIGIMRSLGQLTEAEANQLKNQEIPLIAYTPTQYADYSPADRLNARHFVDYAIAEASEHTGLSRDELTSGSYRIYTTLSTANQTAMAQTVANQPAIQDTPLDAAGVSLRADGSVAAMVGGKNYDALNFNLATDSERDGGSTFKSFVAAVAIEKGIDPDALIDAPTELLVPGTDGNEDWLVQNGHACDDIAGQSPCKMTLRQALGTSSNTAAVQLMLQAGGIEPVAGLMRDLGIPVEDPAYPSLALGSGKTSPLVLATAYNNLLLRQGSAVAPHTVIRVTDSSGRTIWKNEAQAGKQVLQSSSAQETARALQGPFDQYGTASGVIDVPEGTVAGKTGTGTADSDKLFAGSVMTAEGGQTSVFWLGVPSSNTPINNASSYTTAQMWGEYVATLQPSGTLYK